MNFLLRAPIEPKLLSENSTPLLVVIAYDDFIAGQTAMRTYRRLLTQFENESKVQHRLWTFQELRDPRFAEGAILSAAAANLVIVATVNGRVLPGHVKAWIENSLFQREEKDSALAVLVANTKSEILSNVAVHEYLQQVAEEANVQFFSSVFELPVTGAACSLASLWERSEANRSMSSPPQNRSGLKSAYTR